MLFHVRHVGKNKVSLSDSYKPHRVILPAQINTHATHSMCTKAPSCPVCQCKKKKKKVKEFDLFFCFVFFSLSVIVSTEWGETTRVNCTVTCHVETETTAQYSHVQQHLLSVHTHSSHLHKCGRSPSSALVHFTLGNSRHHSSAAWCVYVCSVCVCI